MGEEKRTGGLDDMTRALFIILAIGIILMVIGFDSVTSALVDVGLIFTTLALFAGAIVSKMDGYVRLGMAIAGGFILAYIASAIRLV